MCNTPAQRVYTMYMYMPRAFPDLGDLGDPGVKAEVEVGGV